MITNKENQNAKANEDKKLMEQRRIRRLCSYVGRIRQMQSSEGND